MTETSDLARILFDWLTQDGRITLDGWVDFKTEHGVEPRMIEPVLVEVLSHMCSMNLELTQEVGRLSHALARRTG